MSQQGTLAALSEMTVHVDEKLKPSGCRCRSNWPGSMQPLILQVAMFRVATGDIAGHSLGCVVVTQPFHPPPGPFTPDEIIDPEQRLDYKNAQTWRRRFYRPHRQVMPPRIGLVVATR